MHLEKYINIGDIPHWLCSWPMNWKKTTSLLAPIIFFTVKSHITLFIISVIYVRAVAYKADNWLKYFIFFFVVSGCTPSLHSGGILSFLWWIKTHIVIKTIYYHYYIICDEERNLYPLPIECVLALWRWMTLVFIFVAKVQFCLW